ncbi:MAG: N-acetylmuramic acid 6-phosphate etherase [Chloroflexi bacterium]|nr:N-acetylmuramic acid 6-phosphate etherase [Chloroflexota bacterium]
MICSPRLSLTEKIDLLSTLEIVKLMNSEDAKVASVVAIEAQNIAKAIDEIAARMKDGGRLIYIGAGTSGRLSVLDAAECPPTFNVPPDLVIALIAGGDVAITQAVEGAEDDAVMGAQDISKLNVHARDSIVGVAASGNTPYVVGGITEANRRGALTISIACNRPSKIEEVAHIGIAPLVGAEVLTGSTRLMVDVQATNQKLRVRAKRIVEQACNINPDEAEAILRLCNGEVKTAIVATLKKIAPNEAREKLKRASGIVRHALN